MGLYQNDSGVLTPIAGRGKAEYGASTVRTGTFTINEDIAQGSYKYFTVTFDSPMPDADYMVYFDAGNASGYGKLLNAGSYMVYTKSATGFQIAVAAPSVAIQSGWTISYIAYKLYTDIEYNKLLNGQCYLTDEVDTGKTWINGKKIYRKVVDCGAGPAAGATKTVNHNIANIERFTHLELIGDNNSNYWTIPWFDNNRKWYWYANRTTIYIISGASSEATTYNHLAILEYTKTTN